MVVGPFLTAAGALAQPEAASAASSQAAGLIEEPDNTTAAGLAIAMTSSGAFRKFETTSVMTQGEMLDALHVASNVHYVAPAESVHA